MRGYNGTKAAKVKYATYLYPVKALSKEYSKIFMQLLKASVVIEPEHQPDKELLKRLSDHKWVVYAKQPFYGPKQVIEYYPAGTKRSCAMYNSRWA